MKLLNIKPKSEFNGSSGDYGGRPQYQGGSSAVFHLFIKSPVTSIKMFKLVEIFSRFRGLVSPGRQDSVIKGIIKKVLRDDY